MNKEKLEEQIGMILFYHFQGKNRPSVTDGMKAVSEIMPLIDSATREARIEMLKNMKKSLMVARVNPGLKPLQLPEDARIQQMIADEFDRNIAELNQSNTKRNK